MPGFVLLFIWILWPLLTFAGGLGLGSLMGLAALVCSASVARGFKPRFYLLPLLAFFVFCGVSAMWSPREMALVDFDFSKMKFAVRSEMLRVGLLLVAVGALIAATSRLTEERQRFVTRIASAALLTQLFVVVLLSAFESDALRLFADFMASSGEGVQNISRNALLCALAAPVFALGIAGDGKNVGHLLAAGVILAGAIFAVWYREVQAGLLAMAFAAGAAMLVAFMPKRGLFVLAVAFSAVIMTAPWVLGALTQGADYATADSSPSYRAAIWRHVIELISEQPVWGHGIGVLRTINDPIETGVFAGQMMVPNHSHNMILQLWAETGAIGAGLLSLTLLMVGWRISGGERNSAALRAAALAGGVFAIACVSFDLWNDMFWAAAGMIALLIVCTPRIRMRKETQAVGIVFGEGQSPTVLSEPADLPPSEALMSKSEGIGPRATEGGDLAEIPAVSGLTHNNFNLLRLLFALMVVVYHVIALSNVQSWQGAEQVTSLLAELGVQGFFVLSGYLVFASLQRSRSVGLYAQKRARRLLPGYVAIVLVCVAGALAFSPAAREDLAAVARYLGWNLVFLNFMEPNLPGVFEVNRFSEINGALWTLKIEVMFYLTLPLLAYLLKLAGGLRWALFVFIYVAAEAWRAVLLQLGQTDGGMMLELARQLPGQMSFFIVGIALAAWRDDINWRSPLAPLGIVLFALSIAVPAAIALRAMGLGITSIWIAVVVPRLLDPARFGDLSYGVYIVHFPVIQVAVTLGLFAVSPWMGAAAAVAAALVGAILLWWLIERPALRADSVYRLS